MNALKYTKYTHLVNKFPQELMLIISKLELF